MESVIQRIREARDDKNSTRIEPSVTETTVDGCQVKIRFDAYGDKNIMTAIRSMLISAHLDAVLAGSSGGEQA